MPIDLFKPFMAPNAKDHVAKVLSYDDQGRLYCGEGPLVHEFEQQFSIFTRFTDNPPLMLNSCTSALELALHLAGVGPRDQVITTPMTCTATNGAILRSGATPVWADVDPVTGLIDPADVQSKVTRKTKAIMAVDWGGRSCNYAALRAVQRASEWCSPISVIQDAAHTLLVNPLPTAHGHYVCWSFQAIKHLTTGDGGALLVPIEQRERARLLRWYGLDRESGSDFRCAQDIVESGYKMHMNDIAAAIGLANLPHAGWVVAQQRANAAWYQRALMGSVQLQPWDDGSTYWLYTVLVREQQAFIAFMAERGVMCSPVHRRNDEHSVYADYRDEFLPGVDAFASREVAIPVGWWLSEQDRNHVAAAVWEWVNESRNNADQTKAAEAAQVA